jgi:hypothetical protein
MTDTLMDQPSNTVVSPFSWFSPDDTFAIEIDVPFSGDRNPSYDNNFGIDVDAYDLVIDASTGILPIVATSEKDGIRLAVLALAVDVE